MTIALFIKFNFTFGWDALEAPQLLLASQSSKQQIFINTKHGFNKTLFKYFHMLFQKVIIVYATIDLIIRADLNHSKM